MKRIILILLFAWTYSFASEVNGVVLNYEDQFVRNASVYISGTSVGVLSDNDGNFTLKTDITGNYLLIVSHGAYETVSIPIFLNNTDTSLTIQLQPKTFELEGLTYESDNYSNWKRTIEDFHKYFFGTNYTRRYYEIINPEVIRYSYDSVNNEKVIIFRTQEPLKIINKNIGYEMYCDIKELIGYWDYRIQFDLNIRFKEIEFTSKSERIKTNTRRIKAYKGSARHLFKTLYEGTTFEEDFSFLKVESDRMGNLFPDKNSPSLPNPFEIEDYPGTDFKIIYPPKKLGVKYYESGFFKPSIYSALSSSGKPIVINNYGHIVSSDGSLFFFGDWSLKRFGHTLPFDYKID